MIWAVEPAFVGALPGEWRGDPGHSLGRGLIAPYILLGEMRFSLLYLISPFQERK